MRVAASTLAFSRQPLEVALREIAALGFQFVDIGAIEGWAHLMPSAMAENSEGVAEEVRHLCERYGVTPVAFNAGLGTKEPAEERRRLTALCRVAQRLRVPVITLGASPKGTPLDDEIARWKRLTPIAAEHGITIAVETHFGQVTEDPKAAQALVERVDGLRLTLDPSHFVIQGLTLDDFRPLLPSVAHVHLRDAGRNGWAEVQMPVGAGVVDFRALLAALREVGYDGALSCEYIDTIGDLDIAANLQALKGLLETVSGE
jgi:sugar phosphate isomerase/epimerase